MKIVVIGGTGLIGRPLVEQLRQAGHEVVPASPSTGVDTVTGAGVDAALAGADVVVDVANSPSFEDGPVREFFERSTGTLVEAEKRAGVGHHVVLSIVGADRMPDIGYMRAKVRQEDIVTGSGVPYSILRATQFFEFIKGIADLSTDGNTIRLPTDLIQPMAADDVASAIGRVAVGTPLNRIVEVGGPEQFHLDELVRRCLAARNDPREVVADPEARYYGIKLTETMLLPGPDAQLGETRFETWLSQSTNQTPATARQPSEKTAAGNR